MIINHILRGASLAVLGLGILFAVPAAAQVQVDSFSLKGSRAQNCYITITHDSNAQNLPMTETTHTNVTVGTVQQWCNKKAGYKLVMSSTNCDPGTGAKLAGPVGEPEIDYTISVNNPNTSTDPGDVDTTGQLGTLCTETPPTSTHTLARGVSDWKANGEISTVSVTYTIDSTFGAGDYTDTLTITMSIN